MPCPGDRDMDKSTRKILVTGATGKQGGAVLRHLHERGWPLRAMTRDPSKPSARRFAEMGVEVVKADYNDRESIDRALEGVYGVYLVTTPYEEGPEAEVTHGTTVTDAAKEAGVEHLVYSSVASAGEDTGIQHFAGKHAVEMHIREIELDATVVRPVYFMENLLRRWTHDGIVEGTLSHGIRPDKPVQMVAVDDVGRAVAMVFERPEKYIGKTVDVAGDELTMPEAARLLGEAMDCEVTYRQLPVEDFRRMDVEYGAFLDWMNRAGYHVDMRMARVFDPGAMTFADWVHDAGWSTGECRTLPAQMNDPSVG